MLKAPFRSPKKIIVTQEYGNLSNVDWYKANGLNIPFHNGIDIVLGDSRVTYGTECVCPFPKAKVIRVDWENATSTRGNGVVIEADYEGSKYWVTFWHSGEILVKVGQEVKEGDVLCYIGNSGLCNPKPTEAQPWNGSHCHLGLRKFAFDGLNWKMLDEYNGVSGYRNPRELFDFSQCYIGKDTGLIHDMWVLKQYVVNKTGIALVKYFKGLGI